jgi:hypothetical protein
MKCSERGMELGDRSDAVVLRWADILSASIRLPYASRWSSRLLEGFNVISPKYGEHSPRRPTITVATKTQNHTIELDGGVRYSWRLAFVLDDFFGFLSRRRRISALANSDIMECVHALAGEVPLVARALMYVDLFGLERFFGGRGAYDRRYGECLVARQPPSRPAGAA